MFNGINLSVQDYLRSSSGKFKFSLRMWSPEQHPAFLFCTYVLQFLPDVKPLDILINKYLKAICIYLHSELSVS